MLVASTSVFASTALLPPPALGERRHRGVAPRLVAVRWRTVLVVAKGQRPHPRRGVACTIMIRPTNYALHSAQRVRSRLPRWLAIRCL